MIPIYKVKVSQNVDVSILQFPPNKFLSSQYDKISNHEYTDMRGFDWDSYDFLYKVEKNIIEETDKKSTDIDSFEDLIEELYDTDDYDIAELLGIGLDVGITSSLVALSAYGCAPLVSCRGHPKNSGAYSEYPMIVFYAKKNIAPNLITIATGSNVGLINAENFDGYEGLMMYARSITDMMDFGQALYKDQIR